MPAAEWTQWGGPSGNFHADAQGLLMKEWPASGPKQLWKRPLGEGYAGIVAQGGKLYTGFSTPREEVFVSLDAATGATLWEHRYDRTTWGEMDRGFGLGPNATPLIVGDRVITIGIAGQLLCIDRVNGKVLWGNDLPKTFGRRQRIEEYGYSASPLHHENKIIVQVGGDNHAIVALHPLDGSVLWRSAAGGVSYGGATLRRLAGQDQYIYFEPEGVVALNPANGDLLWRWPIEMSNGNHLTPVVKCDENHLFVTSQFTSGGGRLLKIDRVAEKYSVEQPWFTPKLRSSCWTHIRIGDHIYGSAGSHNTSLFSAFNWRTGKIAWRKRLHHMAQAILADGKLVILDQDGNLSLVGVSPEGPESFGTVTITERVSWTAPTLVGTKLFARDRKNIVALDLAAQAR